MFCNKTNILTKFMAKYDLDFCLYSLLHHRHALSRQRTISDMAVSVNTLLPFPNDIDS